MGAFNWEKRTCGWCGAEWEALDFWAADMPCGKCKTAAYNERLRAINASRPYRVDSIGGACPTQAEGFTKDGRPFYFRARHGEWTLDVGEVGWPDYTNWPIGDAWNTGREVAAGDDPTEGWMEPDDVLAILDAHLP